LIINQSINNPNTKNGNIGILYRTSERKLAVFRPMKKAKFTIILSGYFSVNMMGTFQLIFSPVMKKALILTNEFTLSLISLVKFTKDIDYSFVNMPKSGVRSPESEA
jgi:hypothetical protein